MLHGGGERCATNGALALSLNNNLPKVFIGDLFACTLALNSRTCSVVHTSVIIAKVANRFQTLIATYFRIAVGTDD